MQTFLPDCSFQRCAALLDDRRLGKQRVETLQILRALHLEDYGWSHHPAVTMWRGHTRALVAYGLAVVAEWQWRGRPDTTGPQIAEFAVPHRAVAQDELACGEMPPWLGLEALHRSHRSALVRKDPGRYGALFPDAPADLPYVWPPPPTDPVGPQPFSAWVVRAPSKEGVEALRAQGTVEADPRLTAAGATPKQRRHRDLFVSAMRRGEPVAVPDEAGLLVGVLGDDPVVGDPASRREGRAAASSVAGGLVRTVDWRGRVRRDDLRRPFQLQNPGLVFVLRDEPAVQRVQGV